MTADAPLSPSHSSLPAGGRLRWLLLVYHLPAAPARLRTAVWRQLIAAFNRARDGEYLEIIAQCQDILAGITPGMHDGEIRGAAQAGAALARLTRSYERVRPCDVLGASQAGPAASALAECRKSVDRARRVGS